MGTKMATSSRVNEAVNAVLDIKTCYRCSKVLRSKDVIVDDTPFGLMCLKCEDRVTGSGWT